MSEWISSLQAVKRLKKANPGAPEATLGMWAEEGSLRSAATRGIFSSREDVFEYIFADDSPTDPTQLDRWPAIPSYFWNWVNSKNGTNAAQYYTGIFATAVVPEAEIGSGHETDHIKLYGVSFHSDDLDARLNVRPSTEALAGPPQKRWQRKRLTHQQADALTFIDIVSTLPPKDPLGRVALHNAYLTWHADAKHKRTGTPLVRSAFGKWQDRYLEGWRVNDRLKLVRES